LREKRRLVNIKADAVAGAVSHGDKRERRIIGRQAHRVAMFDDHRAGRLMYFFTGHTCAHGCNGGSFGSDDGGVPFDKLITDLAIDHGARAVAVVERGAIARENIHDHRLLCAQLAVVRLRASAHHRCGGMHEQ